MRLLPKLKRMVGLAVIKLINDAGPYQKVQLDLGPTGTDGKPLQLRDETYVLQHYGFVSHPPIDSDAAVIALGGEANQVLVIATGNRLYRLTGLPEGGVALHDMSGNYLKMTDAGIESVGSTWTHTGPIVVTGDLTVHGETLLDGGLEVTGDTLLDQDLGVSGNAGIDGDLEVLGDITDNAGSNGATVKEHRDAYNGHAHGGIQLGSAGNFTLVTNQPAT
jgi:phage baseplate assembly protein V